MAGIDLLNLNLSILYQFAMYLLTLLVLNVWLIRPIRATLAERRKRLAALGEGGDPALRQAVEAQEKNYAELLSQIRQSSGKLREEVRGDAARSEREALSAAHDKANERLRSGRKEIEDSLAKARTEMTEEIPRLARDLARRLLGREVGA